MSRRTAKDREASIWLGDAPGEAVTDPVLQTVDRLFAILPGQPDDQETKARLRTALAAASPGRVYYDQLPRSAVGPMWVAVSERGVVMLDIGSSEQEFLLRLRRRLRGEAIRSAEPTAEATQQLREYLAGQRRTFNLPLDLSLTREFQRQVLMAALEIPRGSVATYGQIARRIGRPRAARAVGQALGHNPLPILIPCHRVLASDGGLGGYSGRRGVKTKAQLLELEGVTRNWKT